jgi:hypothetical protein
MLSMHVCIFAFGMPYRMPVGEMAIRQVLVFRTRNKFDRLRFGQFTFRHPLPESARFELCLRQSQYFSDLLHTILYIYLERKLVSHGFRVARFFPYQVQALGLHVESWITGAQPLLLCGPA